VISFAIEEVCIGQSVSVLAIEFLGVGLVSSSCTSLLEWDHQIAFLNKEVLELLQLWQLNLIEVLREVQDAALVALLQILLIFGRVVDHLRSKVRVRHNW